ncbi:hypothetical protein EI94DRAFT_1723726 [Lactarius quietus]|nr:hypothetical protein EI94DRAFT_1723726 [Lactarius quietus]
MLLSRFVCSGLLHALLGRGLLTIASTTAPPDPCAKVAGLRFVDPVDALACQKSFPFNETLRQNVISVISRVFDFYTFEDFYLNSPPPFQDSTTDIRAEIARINVTQYATDYHFNQDLWDLTLHLHDGHTRWVPNCYVTYEYILPAPVVIFDDGVFIAPNSVDLFKQLGRYFIDYFATKNVNWQRLAGARVISIGGQSASDYIVEIARTVSANYLDLNLRVNSVVSSYRMPSTTISQRFGDLALRYFPAQTSLNFSLIPVNSTVPEFVDIPFIASFTGDSFTDGPSYWANNCAATNQTNGVDLRSNSSLASQSQSRLVLSVQQGPGVRDDTPIGLPAPSLPTLPPTSGSAGVIRSYILPGNKTGVMFVGNFEGNSSQFPVDVDAAVKEFKASGVKNLLIDVTNNPGGYVELGYFLYAYLCGNESGFPGFQSTSRANPLAQKVVRAGIEQGHNRSMSIYAPDNWQFLNGTEMPDNFDYNDPSVPYFINGINEPTSQRFEDRWPVGLVIPAQPPFDLNNVAIVGNGICGSTCATFTTAMFERHQTKIAVFGGISSLPIEYKGTAGNQVLGWTNLDTEIKTAGLKDDPLSPPDLLVKANMPINWRTAYSYFNETLPIAYVSEHPQYRFPYTAETYSNPQNLWIFAEEQLFG